MLQLGLFNFCSLEALFVNRLFFRSGGFRLAAVLALTLAGTALPNSSWARFPQFDSAALLTPEPTSFAQCPQFFANGTPPAVTPRPPLRELCYEAFAVLHSSTTP
jgi:endonuclease G